MGALRALIMTLGTRGDVQPFVALACGLREVGHTAVLVAPKRFAELIHDAGVEFRGVDDGPLRVLDGGASVGEIAEGGLRAKVALARRLPGLFGRVLTDCWDIASAEAPDIVVHNGQIIAGPHVAERLGVPAVLALPIPMYVPTRAFPWPGVAVPGWLPRSLNRATFLGMKGPALAFARTVDAWRADLGLPRRPGRHNPLRTPDGGTTPTLHAISEHVVGRPSDWPDAARVTGYWFHRRVDSDLSGELVNFLAEGPAPVFIGFGSMAGADPESTTATVLRAAEWAGVRVILGAAWGGVVAPPSSPDVLAIDEAPFDQLFPHVAAVVHHGGAGTVAAAAAAGRPQVVCPFVGDQPFWGDRLHSLGVAPPPIPQRGLSAALLAATISRATTDPDIGRRSVDLGRRIQTEDGVTRAVIALEAVAGRRP
ncbi:glycosyltransferase [Actinokineospora guangxiensis]|uniref:Glycosyltransferase n=1 Tax=Actinokineospora guangxiensis TaxID=1490288 RepID=A0ABW0EYA9_9PSEU